MPSPRTSSGVPALTVQVNGEAAEAAGVKTTRKQRSLFDIKPRLLNRYVHAAHYRSGSRRSRRNRGDRVCARAQVACGHLEAPPAIGVVRATEILRDVWPRTSERCCPDAAAIHVYRHALNRRAC